MPRKLHSYQDLVYLEDADIAIKYICQLNVIKIPCQP